MEVQGQTCVVLPVPVLPARGRGEALLERGWQSPPVRVVNGQPTLPITSVSGPVGGSH